MLAARAAFRALERLAPGLGARWAERLWLTVPPFRGKARADVLPPGKPFTVYVEDRAVRGRTWGTGPVVYLVHGWGGTSSQLHPFVAPLLTAGHRVVTFDALSHGASDPGLLGPRRTTSPEMTDALTAVVAVHGQPHAVIAHSFGASSTFSALRNGMRPARLVFLAPMAQPTPLTVDFAAALGFGERIRTRMIERVARRVGTPWDDYDMPAQLTQLTQLSLPPLLTVHDPADRETHYADSVALAETWPDAELVTVEDLGHWRLLRDQDTITRAVDFVTVRASHEHVS
ncbi:alpha/beta hydrolase [Allokutzneria sp. A3M-2-11 16]|uniref:alpha/beta fold hydrolase n=1 Tax=Allokutzneria sp. A3M-2-11 16 TaxID=2962043 RepID=UPI0020B7E7AA|nr:alpha/beta fold hydrolase [Allokutzneria sp. A3M-2-11 16]MCP3803297.1 alpha/beta hydrolase [Allokutzneria sp. A3M-2-11 16]